MTALGAIYGEEAFTAAAKLTADGRVIWRLDLDLAELAPCGGTLSVLLPMCERRGAHYPHAAALPFFRPAGARGAALGAARRLQLTRSLCSHAARLAVEGTPSFFELVSELQQELEQLPAHADEAADKPSDEKVELTGAPSGAATGAAAGVRVGKPGAAAAGAPGCDAVPAPAATGGAAPAGGGEVDARGGRREASTRARRPRARPRPNPEAVRRASAALLAEQRDLETSAAHARMREARARLPAAGSRSDLMGAPRSQFT